MSAGSGAGASEELPADAGPARNIPVGRLPGRRRVVFGAFALAFWGWLLVRWLYDWVVRPGVGVSRREPFFPAAPFEGVAAGLRDAAATAGPLGGVVEWVAGFFDFLAFGTTVLPALAAGAWLTVLLTVSSILLGLVLAVPLSVARVYGGRALRWSALSYTELVRGTPLLAQLFVLYFGIGLTGVIRELPGVGVGVVPDAAVWVAVIGFTINSAAYQAEYIRSALLSVESGQLTAARAVGLTKLQGIRHVVLPQGLRFAIPGWSNEFVYLIKYSSLAAFITVRELFFRVDSIGSETLRTVEIYTLAALFYLAMVLSASAFMGWVERQTAIPGLGQTGKRGG